MVPPRPRSAAAGRSSGRTDGAPGGAPKLGRFDDAGAGAGDARARGADVRRACRRHGVERRGRAAEARVRLVRRAPVAAVEVLAPLLGVGLLLVVLDLPQLLLHLREVQARADAAARALHRGGRRVMRLVLLVEGVAAHEVAVGLPLVIGHRVCAPRGEVGHHGRSFFGPNAAPFLATAPAARASATRTAPSTHPAVGGSRTSAAPSLSSARKPPQTSVPLVSAPRPPAPSRPPRRGAAPQRPRLHRPARAGAPSHRLHRRARRLLLRRRRPPRLRRPRPPQRAPGRARGRRGPAAAAIPCTATDRPRSSSTCARPWE